MKARQQEIVVTMQSHVKADESFYITANTVLSLANSAKELFESSEVGEKRQLLNFVFQNLSLEGKKLVHTLREPFSMIMTAGVMSKWMRAVGRVQNFRLECALAAELFHEPL